MTVAMLVLSGFSAYYAYMNFTGFSSISDDGDNIVLPFNLISAIGFLVASVRN